MQLLSGKEVAEAIYDKLDIKDTINYGLAVILVGNDESSHIYVNMKEKKCQKLGINFTKALFEEDVKEEEIIKQIKKFNNDSNISGILVQLPLPPQLNKTKILETINMDKDVDGFHFSNIGKLTLNTNPKFVSCTPQACMELIDFYNIDVEGKHVVLIGKSTVVGLPLSILLMNRDATVSVCHARTENIKEITKMADILISCCGRPHLVREDWIKNDTILIDVGITKIKNKIYGDVNCDEVQEKACYLTPVPGGIGPITIAVLMKNVVKAAEFQHEKAKASSFTSFFMNSI